MILEPRIQKLVFAAAQRRDAERRCEWFTAPPSKVNKSTIIEICLADRHKEGGVTAGNIKPRTVLHSIKLQTAMLCALRKNCEIRKASLRNRITRKQLLSEGAVLCVFV